MKSRCEHSSLLASLGAGRCGLGGGNTIDDSAIRFDQVLGGEGPDLVGGDLVEFVRNGGDAHGVAIKHGRMRKTAGAAESNLKLVLLLATHLGADALESVGLWAGAS